MLSSRGTSWSFPMKPYQINLIARLLHHRIAVQLLVTSYLFYRLMEQQSCWKSKWVQCCLLCVFRLSDCLLYLLCLGVCCIIPFQMVSDYHLYSLLSWPRQFFEISIYCWFFFVCFAPFSASVRKDTPFSDFVCCLPCTALSVPRSDRSTFIPASLYQSGWCI